MARKGMDADQVRTFGTQLKTTVADQVRTINGTVRSNALQLNWDGPDAADFKGERITQMTAAFTALIAKLEEFGQTAISNAEAQVATSASL